MDPTALVSIATTAVNLVSACVRLSSNLSRSVNKAKNVDTTVRVLDIEINSLSQVLGSIATSLSDPLVGQVALESQTGHEGNYWRTVKTTLEDCKGTLASLEQIVAKIGRRQVENLFRRVRQDIRLSATNEREIELLKQQVTAYRQTMQLALQMIAVYVPP
jgi:RNA binding exosome subunit